MKKPEIKTLDKIWRDLVKDLAGWRCEHCKIVGIRMEAAHVIGRRHRGTRWGCLLPNQSEYDLAGHCFCHRCHQQYDEHGPMEPEIINVTVGVMRKAILQDIAKHKVTKYQDFNVIRQTLDNIRREKCG